MVLMAISPPPPLFKCFSKQFPSKNSKKPSKVEPFHTHTHTHTKKKTFFFHFLQKYDFYYVKDFFNLFNSKFPFFNKSSIHWF